MTDGQNPDPDKRPNNPVPGKTSGGPVARQVIERGRRLKERYDRTSPWLLAVIALAFFVASLVVQWLIGDSKLLSVLVSGALVTVCLLIFKLGPFFHSEFARAVRAMWMPIAVTVGAGVLLFTQGQGRDLGVGLLGEGPLKLVALCFILIYWGINNWHSARLGLNYEFQKPTGDEHWVFWPPRLLGVCAHLFAAFSLALAGLNVLTATGDSSVLAGSRFFVFAAPLIIGIVALAMWAIDVAFTSENRRKPIDPYWARWLAAGAVACTVILLFVLHNKENNRETPEGLFWATVSISASAVVYLLFVSLNRKRFSPDPEPVSHNRFTVWLAIPAVVAVLVVSVNPTLVGETFGSLNVCFFAFGAVLAVINGIGWFGGFGGFVVDVNVRAQRLKFAGQCAVFLLLLAALTSLMRDFHRVRLCATEPCVPAPARDWSSIAAVAERPSIEEAALAWYDQASRLYHKDDRNRDKPVPMLVIATAGGGIRAAYWTATILEKLQTDLEKKGQALDPLLFAISGVSGGSVGAVNYIAARHFGDKPTAYLQSDFLAPAIASMVFADGPSNFLPDFGQVDRGTALEWSFENGSKGHLAHSFLSFFPAKADLAKTWRPALLLNATHLETGRRMIASNLKIEKDTFLDSFDELGLLGSDLRASTVAHNSARFTYVSPAGKLVARTGSDATSKTANRGYVIDGGYFENYGALTALELARSARQAIKNKGHSVKLVILQISSDPTLTNGRTRVRTIEDGASCTLATTNLEGPPNGMLRFDDAGYDPQTGRWRKNDGEGWVVSYLNELAAPLSGVTAVREARGRLAAAELASAICVERDSVKAATTSEPGRAPQQAGINDLMNAKANTAADTAGRAAPAAPIEIKPGEAPHFAHLAMCEVAENEKAPINPPLGWALSKPMRDKFSEIFKDCGNEAELTGVEAALD